jgi:hypothetical protein
MFELPQQFHQNQTQGVVGTVALSNETLFVLFKFIDPSQPDDLLSRGTSNQLPSVVSHDGFYHLGVQFSKLQQAVLVSAFYFGRFDQ